MKLKIFQETRYYKIEIKTKNVRQQPQLPHGILLSGDTDNLFLYYNAE